MPQLAENPLLSDLQRYVREMEEERGFTGNTLLQQALLLGEETGELLKAIRKHTSMTLANDERAGDVAEELADVFIILCAIANRTGVDLEAAFRAKEEKNSKRRWA